MTRPQRGVAYLALLLAVAITSGALAASASIWSQAQQREREKQLLWAGEQIHRAIVAYSQSGQDSGNNFPAALQDLLLDPRSPARRRYLRQIYDDPMTRSTDWALIRNPQGRIVGVHSRATGVPVKTGRFAQPYVSFEKARTYADWKFTAVPELRIDERPRATSGAAAGSAPDRGGGASAAPPPARSSAKPGPAASAAAAAETAPAKEAPAEPSSDAPDDGREEEAAIEDEAAERRSD